MAMFKWLVEVGYKSSASDTMRREMVEVFHHNSNQHELQKLAETALNNKYGNSKGIVSNFFKYMSGK